MAVYPKGTTKYPPEHLRLSLPDFRKLYPGASDSTYHHSRQRSGIHVIEPLRTSNLVHVRALTDKKVGKVDWREANNVIRAVQGLKEKASQFQNHAIIDLSHMTEPVTLTTLCDTHFGAIGSDVDLLEKVTDEILGTPNLLVGFLGDATEMAITNRSILESSEQVLDPAMQLDYLESWLNSGIAEHIAFSTWGNHDTMRQQKFTGDSAIARAFARRLVYFDGIGHIDLIVGSQTYRLAVSHKFRGSSLDHPCHSGIRYLSREGVDREIALAGDSHRPGMETVVQAKEPRVAINGGSLHLNSHYAKQNFSLFTSDAFPAITFYPDEHLFNPWWSLAHWRHASGIRQAQPASGV